jgi:cytochrome c peroxidase
MAPSPSLSSVSRTGEPVCSGRAARIARESRDPAVAQRARGSRNSRKVARPVAQWAPALALATLAACAAPEPAGALPEIGPGGVATSPIVPIPREPPIALDPDRVEIGRELFGDPILSHDRTVRCLDCHVASLAGADGNVVTDLPTRGRGGINVPTIYNLAWVFRYSWSGRHETLQQVFTQAMEAPAAMDSTWAVAAENVAASPDYRARFAREYPDGVTEETVRDAVAQYVLSLTTPDAPFDRWLRDEAELDPEALAGYRLFVEYGCSSCHQGVNVGGNMYQRFGVMDDYFARRGTPITPADLGIGGHVFRVPSLRNVALTAPYFHDGSAPTLESAIETMARYQLGRPIEPAHVARIAAFLRSLTGTIDSEG